MIAKGGSKYWSFLFEYHGKQREIGLGGINRASLAEARRKAAEYRSMLDRGVDPLEERGAAGGASRAPNAPTFGAVADMVFAVKSPAWRSLVHKRQWITSIQTYAAAILMTPVDQVDRQAALVILQPIWLSIPETARRLRARCEEVIDYAGAHNLRSGENPFRWKGGLAHVLPKRPKLEQTHHAAMPYAGVPAFVAQLREQETVSRLALEFLILTAGRSAEICKATWDEIDGAVWTVPAVRMKAGVSHRVPLVVRALQILAIMRRRSESGFIFPGRRAGRPISPDALAALLPDGCTTHGFRSSFRDWCGEETMFPREVAEGCLAHSTGSAVEKAYRRGDALEKRRPCLEAWSAYLAGAKIDNVIAITGGRK